MKHPLAILLSSTAMVLSKVFPRLNFRRRDNAFSRATVERAGPRLSMRKILIA